MAKGKVKTVFFCKECGCESPKWMGQCPACHEWNTMIEEVVAATGKVNASGGVQARLDAKPKKLSEITTSDEDRTLTGIGELDRVLGGGIVPGSLTLVGGDPGIGKSTLLLQMCRELSQKGHRVMYVSGEESPKQIKMRAKRIGSFANDMDLLCETSLDAVGTVLKNDKPEIAIIDSIQTMFNEEISGAPGSVSQVRESTAVLMQLAKTLGISIFIVGHVTKEGTVAGPRLLEHMVDTVLYFEGDRHASYRILRGVKNRFGSTNEIGVFEMQEAGLVEVPNPSEYMLSGRPMNTSGTVTTCSMEGTRPILLEIQSLVASTGFPVPRRQSVGADLNRVNLLIAVLEKRLSLSLGNCDAYVNIAGGMRVNEPAVDLGIIMAVISSYLDIAIDDSLVAFGEVGLGGEIRGINMIEQRVSECAKLGFTTIVLPKVGIDRVKGIAKDVKLIPVENVSDVLKIIKKSA